MITLTLILITLAAAGAGVLAVRVAFSVLRWLFGAFRVLLGLGILAGTVFYYFPRLFGGGETAEG